jgi:hypothetical protein
VKDAIDDNGAHEKDEWHDIDFEDEKEAHTMKTLWESKKQFVNYVRTLVAKRGEPAEKADNNRGKHTIIDAFEKVFERPMNVREYLFHKTTLRDWIDDLPMLTKAIYNIKEKHQVLFNSVSSVLSKYLDRHLTEVEFIKSYIQGFDVDDFVATLKRDIIASQDYAFKMKERLCDLYEQLYDDAMDDDEVRFLFERIKNKEYELFDDSLNNEIVEFKGEADVFAERLYKIFMETYEREPDEHELAKYIKVYRNNEATEKSVIDDDIIEELQDSLEYHDVIKNKIKKLYANSHDGKLPSPSIVYKVLKQILEDKSSFENIDASIEKSFGQLVSL